MSHCRRRACAAFVVVALLLTSTCPAATAATPTTKDDGPRSSASCLMFVARNLARGGGNFYIYQTFSREKLDLKKGDVLEYDIYLAQANPEPVGGIDLDTEKANLRDTGAVDQAGVRAHGNSALTAAVGKWHHRRIPLDALVNQAAHRWTINFEGDKPGTYARFVD